MRLHYLLIICALFIFLGWTFARGDNKLVPPGVRYTLKARASIIKMPPLDSVKLNICYKCGKVNKLKSLPFAYNFDVNFTTENGGLWQTLPDSSKLWSLNVSSNGAYSLSLVFSGLHLPAGHKVYVYNPNHPENFEYYTSADNARNIFVTMPIAGQNLRIEYFVPDKAIEKPLLQIVKISHAYYDIFKGVNTGFGAAGPCNVDINCPEGVKWQKEKGSVARLLITKTTDAEFCTGVLLNNTNYDGRPYLLTAEHCIESSTEAQGTIFYFDYESPSCHGPDGKSNKIIRGSQLRAISGMNDFTLVELNNVPNVNFHPYYAGWNNLDQTASDTVTTIHHPEGDVKKISFSYSQPSHSTFNGGVHPFLNDAHWRISRWDVATTEQGSSGCPLFDQDHLVIGTLSGGDAVCDNPINDYFERFSKAWAYYADSTSQLKYWLDPLRINPASIDGYNPYVNFSCDTFSNFEQNVSPVLLPYDNGKGYISGHNSDSITSFAESYYLQDTLYVNGLYLNIAKNTSSMYDSIEIFVLDGNSPLFAQLYKKTVSLNNLGKGFAYVDVYPVVQVSKNFLVGYTIRYLNSDTFAVYDAPRIPGKLNTAFVFFDGQWRGVNEISAGGYGTSFDVQPLICTNEPSRPLKIIKKQAYVSLFPNPASEEINILLPYGDTLATKFEIYNLSGKKIYSKTNKPNGSKLVIPVNNWTTGLYILKITSDISSYTVKFVVSK